MAYCTVAAVRLRMRGIGTDKVSDADITSLIEEAEGIIDDYAGHDFDEHEGAEEYYDGDEEETLLLRNRPVIEVTTVEGRNSGAFAELTEFDPETGEGNWHVEDLSAGILAFEDPPSEGVKNIRVTYSYGYETVPGNIAALAAVLAAIPALAIAANVVNPSGLASVSQGSLSWSWSGGAYKDTVDQLQRDADRLLAKVRPRFHSGGS